MSTYQITCRKTKNDVIQSVTYVDEFGKPQTKTVGEVIKEINGNVNKYQVKKDFKTVDVIVKSNYLTTEPDTTTANNLKFLKECL